MQMDLNRHLRPQSNSLRLPRIESLSDVATTALRQNDHELKPCDVTQMSVRFTASLNNVSPHSQRFPTAPKISSPMPTFLCHISYKPQLLPRKISMMKAWGKPWGTWLHQTKLVTRPKPCCRWLALSLVPVTGRKPRSAWIITFSCFRS